MAEKKGKTSSERKGADVYADVEEYLDIKETGRAFSFADAPRDTTSPGQGSTEQLTIHVDRSLHREIREQAQKAKKSVDTWVQEALKAELQRQKAR
jgi:predicted HicB family RNase H-like nuclease